jgi:hypothetical protein
VEGSVVLPLKLVLSLITFSAPAHSLNPAHVWASGASPLGRRHPGNRPPGHRQSSEVPGSPAKCTLQLQHPVGDGSPDLVRRIFLNEMDPRHRLLGQRWPPADEVDQRIVGEDRTRLGLQEQLGHIARP